MFSEGEGLERTAYVLLRRVPSKKGDFGPQQRKAREQDLKRCNGLSVPPFKNVKKKNLVINNSWIKNHS